MFGAKMKKHKWHNEIKAWADGAEIQHRMGDNWIDCKTPQWGVQTEYRIKPQPKLQYLYVISDNCGNLRITKDKDDVDNLDNSFDSSYIGKIKLEVNDEKL